MKPEPPKPNADGDIDPEEILAASSERVTAPTEPELTNETKDLVEWDVPPGTAGSAAPVVRPEDENAAGEILVNEGIEEADREQRMAAADPDFEP
jgi:hypothetical protein